MESLRMTLTVNVTFTKKYSNDWLLMLILIHVQADGDKDMIITQRFRKSMFQSNNLTRLLTKDSMKNIKNSENFENFLSWNSKRKTNSYNVRYHIEILVDIDIIKIG